MNYLFDTNAISEASKKKPDASFMEWFKKTDELTMYTSCIVLGEIKKGVSLIQDKERYERLDSLLTEILLQFDGRIINVDNQVSFLWAELLAAGQLVGRTPPVIDALIAAQCIAHDLTLVTRNVRDFEQFTGLTVHAPWTD
jgi:predicted nucleic acid-binding protein